MSRLSTAILSSSRRKGPQLNFKVLNLLHSSLSPIQPFSHASFLKDIKELKPLQKLHAHTVTSGLSRNIFLSNSLLNSYLSCGLLSDAQKLFREIPNKNLVSWTILISGFNKNGKFVEAINVFSDMMVCGRLMPNAVTVASIIPAFGKLGLTQFGKSVHGFWVSHGFRENVFVETALVDMYSKFGCVPDARKLFDRMSERNAVSWNAIISGYSENGSGEVALQLSNLMRRAGFSVDYYTIMSMISASLSDLQVGRGIHGFAIRTGFENDELIRTALMDMYISGNFIDDAYCVFNEIPAKDVVTWTLMLAGFSSGQYWKRTMEHFNRMIGVGVALDSVSFTSILSGCSCSGALQQGRQVHSLILKSGFEGDIFVGSAVIDMYANCGNLEDARRFFKGMEHKDVACWNAMIAGNGLNGYGNDAIDLFWQMEGSGMNPNESTLTSVLSACSHARMVEEGIRIFNHMVRNWKTFPSLKHYACVIDLLGRAGRLDDAYVLIDNLPLQPDFEVYGSLLSACKVHNNIELGIEISHKLLGMKPNDAGYFVLLSNIYALAGNWEGAETIRLLLESEGLKKDPGFSSVEIDGEMQNFVAG